MAACKSKAKRPTHSPTRITPVAHLSTRAVVCPLAQQRLHLWVAGDSHVKVQQLPLVRHTLKHLQAAYARVSDSVYEAVLSGSLARDCLTASFIRVLTAHMPAT